MDHLADAPIANILILAGVIFLAVGLFGRVGGFIGSIFGNIEAGKNSRVLAGVLGVFLILGGGWLHEDSHKAVSATPSSMTPVAGASSTSPSSVAHTPTQASAPPAATSRAVKTKPAARKTSPDATSSSVAQQTPILASDRENVRTPALPVSGDDRLVGTWTNLMPRPDSIRKFEIVRDGQGMNLHLWYACPSGDCDVGSYRLDFSGSTPTYEYDSPNRRRVTYLTLQTPNVLHVRIDLFDNGTWYKRNHWVFTKSTISESLRSAFSRYFEARGEKAFAMAPGTYAYQHGEDSLDSAKQKALLQCEKYAARSCSLILVGNEAAN